VKEEPLTPEAYLYLKEDGIDIDTCEVDYQKISVRCEDISRYRKAFRVKIRALIKLDDMIALKRYVNQFYSLAQFVQYLYGFHSCSSSVETWQEELARHLQTKFEQSATQTYRLESWLNYKSIEDYTKLFKNEYKALDENLEHLRCIQDAKPFLNLKDKAHFEKCYTV